MQFEMNYLTWTLIVTSNRTRNISPKVNSSLTIWMPRTNKSIECIKMQESAQLSLQPQWPTNIISFQLHICLALCMCERNKCCSCRKESGPHETASMSPGRITETLRDSLLAVVGYGWLVAEALGQQHILQLRSFSIAVWSSQKKFL